MKRKILVPIFASMMALSMNNLVNADNAENKTLDNTDNKNDGALQIGEFKDVEFQKASVKDGVAVKIREEGAIQHIAYTGDEYKVVGTQGDWVKIQLDEENEGWIANRYVDVKYSNAYITEEKVNLREESNTDSKIIEELDLGLKLEVVKAQENWVKVKSGDKEGFVNKAYVADKAPVIEVEENTTVQISNNQERVLTSSNESSNSSSNQSNSNPSSSQSNGNSSSSQSNSNSSSSSSNNGGSSNSSSNESHNPPSSSSSAVQAVLNLAYAKLGSPYVWGAEGPNSFDCSGFTSYVMRNAAGVSIPRTSSSQAGYGTTVSRSNLQPGDLVFFATGGGGVSHVGIYIGGGQMIHAPHTGDVVKVTSINSSYYQSAFVTAKRVL